MKSVNKYMQLSTVKPLYIYITLIYFFSLTLSATLDKSPITNRAIYPWDSRVYLTLSKKLFESENYPLDVNYPWGTRILFPFLSGGIERLTRLSEIQSSLLVNELCVLILCFFSAWLWKKMGLKNISILMGIMVICLSPIGPLRTTMYYPGNGYAFECALCALTFASLHLINKRGFVSTIIYSAVLFILALGREFSTYIVVLFTIRELAIRIYEYKSDKHSNIRNPRRTELLSLMVASMSSLAGFLVTHQLTYDSRGNFPFLRAAFTNGWEHLNLFNASYPFFYALGPVASLLILKLTFSKKEQISNRNSIRSTNNFFVIIGVMFSLFVGGDTDRFIWWFFPFLSGIALSYFEEMNESKYFSKVNLISLLLVTVLWTRLFLPAAPPIKFVGEKLDAFASVRTDYSQSEFKGPNILRNFINEGEYFLFDDPAALDILSKRVNQQKIFLPASTIESKTADGLRDPMYKFRINEFPIPFGFVHNNYEMFTLHPQHGERMAKIIFFAQWIALQIYLTISIVRRKRIGIRKWA
jgi:hypothetical protein